MNRGKVAAVALDTEFLKTHGQVLASVVAFVPFASNQHNTKACKTTIFGEPIVVGLRPEEVMRRADVLPCGHCLLPFLEKAFVNGEELVSIQHKYTQVTARESSGEEESGSAVVPLASSGDNTAAAPIEKRVEKGIISLCPYSIPNFRRADKASLQALYTAPTTSLEFREAAKSLSYLRVYGKGRRQRPAASFLMWEYPEFLQQWLRASFVTVDEWCAWLCECGDFVEKELTRVTDRYRQEFSALGSTLSSSSSPAQTVVVEALRSSISGHYRECESVEELSLELNRTWSLLLHKRDGGSTKFYTYGNMDEKAIHNTLQISCCSLVHHSPRATQAGKVNVKASLSSSSPSLSPEEGNSSRTSSSVSITPVSSTMLASPFQAQVVDLTRHPLFATSGFRGFPKAIPSLMDALKKAATVNEAAGQLCEEDDPHNPIWDAKALACISVACGVGN